MGLGAASSPTQTSLIPSAKPDYVPAEFWDDKSSAIKDKEFGAHLAALTEVKTAQDARLAARPGNPDGYELALPKDFKLPEGLALKFDDKDPRVPVLRSLAHDLGFDQATFSKLLTVEAQRVMAEDKMIKEAQLGEQKKLGTNAAQRVTAATTWLKGLIGDKGQQLVDRMALASDIEALEDLQRAFVSSGAGSFSGNGRDNQPAAREKTIAERLYPNLPSGLPPASVRSA